LVASLLCKSYLRILEEERQLKMISSMSRLPIFLVLMKMEVSEVKSATHKKVRGG